MLKIAQELADKYLKKEINKYCFEVFKDNFEELFKKYCENKVLVGNDTTIGIISRSLESLAKEIITDKLMNCEKNALFNEFNISTNPFFNIYYDLIHTFKGYLVWCIHYSIECNISEMVSKKSKELKQNKIIDEHGDYIN